jgi:hypothetical protein
MGLDLHHYIPAVKDDESFDYFTLDEFIDNPGFIQRYQHLIGEVEQFDHYHEILVFPDLLTKEMILQTHEDFSEKPILIGQIEDLKEQINQIASANSITENELLFLKIVDNIITKDSLKEIFYHSISYETNPKVIKVLFHTEKGYQRKGMNSKFYEDFINDKLYFDKTSVLKAYDYLEPRPGDSKEELQKNFKIQFIDNFIEGESIFLASW